VRTHGSTRSATARTPRTPGELRRHASNYFGERVNRVGSILHAAHAQDFERRKKPEVGREEQDGTEGDSDSESDKDGGEGERGGTDEAERTLEDLIGEERRVRALVEQERASNDVEAGRGRENENGHGNGQARQDDGSRGAMGTMRRRRSSARS
jgi:xenotropic and polytropic retrovirus receptor 1